MPHEFPEAELEAVAIDCEYAGRDWLGDGSKNGRRAIAEKWFRRATVIRQAIDAHRETANAPPLNRRQRFAAIVNTVAEQMDLPRAQPVERPAETPRPAPAPQPAPDHIDHKALAAGDA